MKVRSLKDIERDIRKETEKANTAAQYDMYASSVDDSSGLHLRLL